MTSKMFNLIVISALLITAISGMVAVLAARTPGAPHWVLFTGFAVIVGFGLQSLWTQREN
jgi:hypothetical protein